MQGSDDWIANRKKHAVTWSEAGNAIGVGYDSRQMYMKRKLGMVAEKEANWRMLEGNKREPHIAELYFRIMGAHYQPVRLWTDNFRSDWQDKRMGGSPDRIVEDVESGRKWLLEIKTCPDGNMRTEIPITHLIQMCGLCHTYKLPFAHYICSSYGQGILIAEVHFTDKLWDKILFPRLQEFADLWSIGALPERMNGEEKKSLVKAIRKECRVIEIPSVRAIRQTRQ